MSNSYNGSLTSNGIISNVNQFLVGHFTSSNKINEYNKAILIKEGRSDEADEMRFQDLLVKLEKLNFTVNNPLEIKSYLFKNKDLFARLLLICQKTKELFSDVNEFSLVLNTDREDPTFKSLELILKVDNFTEEIETRISNFMMSKTFDFLQYTNCFFFIFQEN